MTRCQHASPASLPPEPAYNGPSRSWGPLWHCCDLRQRRPPSPHRPLASFSLYKDQATFLLLHFGDRLGGQHHDSVMGLYKRTLRIFVLAHHSSSLLTNEPASPGSLCSREEACVKTKAEHPASQPAWHCQGESQGLCGHVGMPFSNSNAYNRHKRRRWQKSPSLCHPLSQHQYCAGTEETQKLTPERLPVSQDTVV